MLNEYTDHWISTYTDKKFHYLNPTEEEICIEDIAHALALTCRFGGHCSKFYSVAEHSIRVSNIVPETLRLQALLHDAHEAYLHDVPRPIKEDIPQYKIMIFVDGDYWHCHSRFNYKDDQIIHHGLTKREINDKDSTQENYLKWKGYQVLRFWEYDIKNKIHEVESKLMEVIRNDIKRKNEVV